MQTLLHSHLALLSHLLNNHHTVLQLAERRQHTLQLRCATSNSSAAQHSISTHAGTATTRQCRTASNQHACQRGNLPRGTRQCRTASISTHAGAITTRQCRMHPVRTHASAVTTRQCRTALISTHASTVTTQQCRAVLISTHASTVTIKRRSCTQGPATTVQALGYDSRCNSACPTTTPAVSQAPLCSCQQHKASVLLQGGCASYASTPPACTPR